MFPGGTVDITVHEVVDGKNLKELNSASGGAWGGTRVDEAFTEFLIKITGMIQNYPIPGFDVQLF